MTVHLTSNQTLKLFLIGPEKDVLRGLLADAPVSAEKTSLLDLLSRSGPYDCDIRLTRSQVQYIQDELPRRCIALALSNTKYGSPECAQIVWGLLKRCD